MLPIGYFKIWRELFAKPIWLNSSPEQKTILITLMAMANFSPRQWEWKGKKFTAEPGQFVTSLDSIIKLAGDGISAQNIRTALQRFEKLEFLTNESTNEGRLITITNWALYQSDTPEPTKQLTGIQQAPNKQLTSNKEYKNIKNNIIVPTIEQVKEYCESRKNGIDPYKWFDYYTANGWKVGKNSMKDWQAAVRTWERNTQDKPKYQDLTGRY